MHASFFSAASLLHLSVQVAMQVWRLSSRAGSTSVVSVVFVVVPPVVPSVVGSVVVVLVPVVVLVSGAVAVLLAGTISLSTGTVELVVISASSLSVSAGVTVELVTVVV